MKCNYMSRNYMNCYKESLKNLTKIVQIFFDPRYFKGAYWIIQRFLVHYQIHNLSNIATLSFIRLKKNTSFQH